MAFVQFAGEKDSMMMEMVRRVRIRVGVRENSDKNDDKGEMRMKRFMPA